MRKRHSDVPVVIQHGPSVSSRSQISQLRWSAFGCPGDRCLRHQSDPSRADGFTSLKERAGVKGRLCPFLGRFRAGFGHAGRRAGGPGGAPGWTNDLEAGPSPGSHWIRPGTVMGYVGGAPRGQVVSLAGSRLRSSLRGCPRLVAAGAWGGFACGQRDQSDRRPPAIRRGPVKPAITRCPRPGLLTPPSASWRPGCGPGRRASRRRPR
jgi:hypothetical protein